MSANITIIEATTRYINVDVLNGDETRMDISGYKAYLSIVCDNTLIVRRPCEIVDNVVSTKLLPKDTIGRVGHSMEYEIRIIDDETNTVLAIQSGKIKVNKSIDPIIIETPDLVEDVKCKKEV